MPRTTRSQSRPSPTPPSPRIAALTDLSTAATDKFTQQLLQRARTDPGIVVTQSQGDCDVRSTHCQIVLMDPNTPAQVQVYPPPQVIGDLLLVMGEILRLRPEFSRDRRRR